eukprot:m.87196 g.87196  ORF g.87196 m.87196 type:complete len:329 (+) comp26044_c0_seq2:145-1131(+)
MATQCQPFYKHHVVNGIKLRYMLLGGATTCSQLLVLHHGYQASLETWEVFAHHVHSLNPSLAVLCFDCRGAGGSEGANDDESTYTFDQLASDTIGLVDGVYKQGASFQFGGHSMGILIGVHLMMNDTTASRVSSLTLVAGAPMAGLHVPQEYTDMWHTDWLRARTCAEARNVLISKELAELGRLEHEEVPHDATPQLLRQWMATYVDINLACTPAHVTGLWKAMQGFELDVDKLLARPAPESPHIFIVLGGAEMDFALRYQLTDYLELKASAGGTSLHVFHGVGHGVPRTIPRTFAAVWHQHTQRLAVHQRSRAAQDLLSPPTTASKL